MIKLIRSFLCITNTLNVVIIALFFIFATHTIIINYKKISGISKEIEEEYHNTINKYRKLLIFLLKNNLPINILHINSTAAAAYKIPTVKSINIFDSKNIKSVSNNSIMNNNDDSVTGCYGGKCINIIVEKRKLLSRLINDKFLYYFELTQFPISKLDVLKLSINKFVTENILLNLILLYLAIFYFSQSLWLFFSNSKLKKINFLISEEVEKKKIDLENQIINNDMIYRSITIAHELLDEYFTHYINKILTENIFIEEIALKDILQQLEDYCSGHLVKQGLKLNVELNHNDNLFIKSDRSVLFIILLNHIHRSVTRAKIASEIKIIVKQDKNTIYIDLEDIGYEYIPRVNNTSNKFYLCELPKQILEELYYKIGIKISEKRNNDNNKTSINIMKELVGNFSDSKIIKFKPHVSRN